MDKAPKPSIATYPRDASEVLIHVGDKLPRFRALTECCVVEADADLTNDLRERSETVIEQRELTPPITPKADQLIAPITPKADKYVTIVKSNAFAQKNEDKAEWTRRVLGIKKQISKLERDFPMKSNLLFFAKDLFNAKDTAWSEKTFYIDEIWKKQVQYGGGDNGRGLASTAQTLRFGLASIANLDLSHENIALDSPTQRKAKAKSKEGNILDDFYNLLKDFVPKENQDEFAEKMVNSRLIQNLELTASLALQQRAKR